MTPEEEAKHKKFMDKVNEFVEKLRGKYPDPEPSDTGDVDYFGEDETYGPKDFHLDSVPVSQPPVKADTKRVPNTLRDMVEGK